MENLTDLADAILSALDLRETSWDDKNDRFKLSKAEVADITAEKMRFETSVSDLIYVLIRDKGTRERAENWAKTYLNLSKNKNKDHQQEAQPSIMELNILGFSNYKKWALTDTGRKGFKKLVSLKNEDVGFHLYKMNAPEYVTYIFDNVIKKKDIKNNSTFDIYCIVCGRPSSLKGQLFMNLRGPIIVNNDTLKGDQVILKKSFYSTRHKITVHKDSVAIHLVR